MDMEVIIMQMLKAALDVLEVFYVCEAEQSIVQAARLVLEVTGLFGQRNLYKWIWNTCPVLSWRW